MELSSWRLESTDHAKFPFRISLLEGKNITLSLFTQDKWPGTKGNIFCLANIDEIDDSALQIIEEIPIISIKRLGKKLSIVLDRATKKRCEFLFLEKQYKNKAGTYEQIFFRTQSAIRQHRSKGSLVLRANINELDIIIDSNERYPWKFTDHHENRQKLSAGDYGLLLEDNIAAIVERKTFDNMLSEVAQIQLLHQQLIELAIYPHAALVIEAQYGDFMDPTRIKPWSAAYLSRVFAELTTIHCNLPIIFAGNRKQANHWVLRFFEAVAKKHGDKTTAAIANVIAKARPDKHQPVWIKVKHTVLTEMPEQFKTADLSHQLPDVGSNQLRGQLLRLQDEGLIVKQGKGRGSVWVKHR